MCRKHQSRQFIRKLSSSWQVIFLITHRTWRERFQVVTVNFAPGSSGTMVEGKWWNKVKFLRVLPVKESIKWFIIPPLLQRLQPISGTGIVDDSKSLSLKWVKRIELVFGARLSIWPITVIRVVRFSKATKTQYTWFLEPYKILFKYRFLL